MKKYILFILLVCISYLTIQSQNGGANKDVTIENLTANLCLNLQSSASNGHEKTGDNIERQFMLFLNITKETPNYKKLIAEFWNEHSDKFICLHKIMHANRAPQHLMKRALDLGIEISFFNKYLFKFKDPKIDFNAVEIYEGKEETIIDYIDNILATEVNNDNYELNSAILLRRILINKFGAKKASELKD